MVFVDEEIRKIKESGQAGIYLKGEKPPTYQMTKEELRKYQQRARKEAQSKLADFAVLAPMWVLRNNYGFGTKRLTDFAEYLQEVYNDIEDGYLDLKDISKAIKEETGLVVKIREK